MGQARLTRVTGEEIIRAVGENMRQGLEPLLTKILAPSLYQIYLHREDFDRLRTVLDELAAETREHLDRELAKLNRRSGSLLQRLRDLVRGRRAPVRTYTTAAGEWHVQFQEDPNGVLKVGEVEVVSELGLGEAASYGAGTETRRIENTRALVKTNSRSPPGRDTVKPVAWFHYTDDGGSRTYSMTKDEIVIGREAEDVWVDLPLETPLDVSREHARVRREAESGRFWIKDLSQYGTTVNGESVPTSIEVVDGHERDRDHWVELPHGALIELASVLVLEFEKAESE